MTQVPVKVCGITRVADAMLAAELGAAALGFVFWPKSPRRIDPAEAGRIGRSLPPFVSRVGVFVDASPDEIARHVDEAGLDVVQLHGDEQVSEFATLKARIVKSVTLASAADLDAAASMADGLPLLVDAADRERRGGTGQRANWTLAGELARRRTVILAGGLTADNVGEALHLVRPAAIDVSSGVESAPGIKDPDRLRRFLAAVGAAGREDA
jgi:phosphoribosylanthranilate isomerase